MITIIRNGKAYVAYCGHSEQIQDRNLERFVKKLANDPEIETAYWLNEFNLERLEEEDREEVLTQLRLVFIKDTIFYEDDDTPVMPTQHDHDFVNGNSYGGYS